MRPYADYLASAARPCAVVAHRGLWRESPENSLAAIEAAIGAGCDVVEIDVRQSADGELLLMHDATLQRMTGRDGVPEALALDALREMTLRARNGGEANALSGETVPSLRDVFDLVRDRIYVHLDVKHRDLIPGVLACARDMGVIEQVDVWGSLRNSADLGWVREIVAPHGAVFIAKTRLNAADGDAQLGLLFELSPPVCEIYFGDLGDLTGLRRLFEQSGIALWVNTLDDIACAGFTDTAALKDPEAVWGRLIDAGISVIQTDEPVALKAFVDGRG
jgi:hypothetical protein